MDELVGSLLTHEMKLKQGQDTNNKGQDINKKVGVALNQPFKKKKSVVKREVMRMKRW